MEARPKLIITISACLVILTGGFSKSNERQAHRLVAGDQNIMIKKKIAPEEVLKQLRNLKELGFDVGANIPEDGPEGAAYAKLINQRMVNQEGNVSETLPAGSLAAGKLRIYAVRNPESWDYRTNEADRYVEDFGGFEWIALFRDVLKCPMGIDQPLGSGEDTREWRERNRLRFQQAIPHYPMLGRIWDTYSDVIYTPAETGHLRDECLRVKTGTSDAVAIRGLDKLIHACDEALTDGIGMYLSSD